MPTAAAMRMASSNSSCGGMFTPASCMTLINRMLENAPIIMMPSSAMFTTPERSLNMPPRATTRSGMEKNIIC